MRISRVNRALPVVLLAAAGCSREPTVAAGGRVEPGGTRAAIAPGPYVPGQSYYGRNQYVEYIAGNSPVILSAPHGGDLVPAEIPDRTGSACGGSATTTRDLNTRELVLAMRQRFHARFGRYPHVVVNHLHRRKLDANRDVVEGACGDPEAQTAWNEFQDFLGVAKDAVLRDSGRGWYMDMHGHGHEIQRLELGYQLRSTQLDLSDAALDANRAYQDTSSIRTMSEFDTGHSFSALLRGPASLGTLYANNGFPSVPSSGDPGPGGDPYFRGGYNSERHGCGAEASALGGVTGGNICGVQIEANYTGVRDNSTSWNRFGDVTAAVLDTYLSTHWGIQLSGGASNTPPAAGFTHSCTGLSCSFRDTSTDADGSVAAWRWDFGDGAVSSAQHPTHAFTAGGTYTVTLTVTDNAGATGTTSRSVAVTAPAAGISLQARGYKVKGVPSVDLTWSGAASASVDVFRNDVRVATTANDGAHTDTLGGKSGGSYTYRVCEAGTSTCSNAATVVF